ncbi:MAG: hypothetical protein ACPL3B_03170 [Fervidobacterium sp.]
MRKVLISLLLLSVLGVLFAGSTQLSLAGGQGVWTQTLTFSVRQWVRVTWDYDPANAVAIDDTTGEANVGNLSFQSNKAFKVWYSSSVVTSGVSVTVQSVKIGSVVLSNNSSAPTQVASKNLSGAFIVAFDSGVNNLDTDFSVKFDFTFLPF